MNWPSCTTCVYTRTSILKIVFVSQVYYDAIYANTCKFLCVHMKDGGNMELVIQNVP